jgi:hypothetical protein
MKNAALCLMALCAISCRAQLPDAPSAVQAKPAHFLTFRTWKQPAPLRPNRDVLTSKTWLAANSYGLVASFADSEVTHEFAGKRCVEANSSLPRVPTRGELYRQNLIPTATVGALGFLLAKYMWHPLGLAGGVYGGIIHTKGALSWRGYCAP